MTLDNSGMDYSRMLIFVFCFSCLLENLTEFSCLLAPPATPGLRFDYKVALKKLSKNKI